jgi:hypothetical protein
MKKGRGVGENARPSRRELLEEIEREKAEHRRRSGDIIYPFLNNFPGWLPGGFYREILETELRDMRTDNPAASPKRRSMTPAQLCELIDHLIPEVGLDAGTIASLQGTGSGKIYEYAYPLYLRLREEGFNHYPDLTA